MSDLRLGIDVGGTNTDAVIVDDDGQVLASHKAPTTPDPAEGIRASLAAVLGRVDESAISSAMLGTTQPSNALIEGRGLARVGALRLAAPATAVVPPRCGWSPHLVQAIDGPVAVVGGGFQLDGSPIVPLDRDAIKRFADACAGVVDAIAVCGVFSPACPDQEQEVEALLHGELGERVPVTSSHRLGQLGLLERENASILNAALGPVLATVVDGFETALHDRGVDARVYITQNDGTAIAAEEAVQLPVLSMGCGATNSLRGAAFLTKLEDTLVIDVGGTSSDVGILIGGFPRESARAVEIGGVRTNFRMPDLVSIGLGGGTVVHDGDGVRVGPDSVGYRLSEDALLYGGTTTTLTDVAVVAGRAPMLPGAVSRPKLSTRVVNETLAWVDEALARLCERAKLSRAATPLVTVGGAAGLVPDELPGIAAIITPEHHAVANAIGAAIAEASGTADRIYRYDDAGRDAALDEARAQAVDAAIRAGAIADAVRVVSVTEVPLVYTEGDYYRVRTKAAGPLEHAPAPVTGRNGRARPEDRGRSLDAR